MRNGTTVLAEAAVPWWKEITREQWRALLAGKIGWMLDAFDVMLYVFCLRAIMDEWHLNPATAGFMVTVTLFAVCSGLSGLSQNLLQLAVARTILGLGMGGEWAAGALLVSETWPARHRGKAIGLMQGGWALGYILAAIAAATILPWLGWRAMFFLGIIPALFILWVRSKVQEPEVWLRQKREAKAKPSAGGVFLQIFSRDLVRFTLLSTMISTFVMFAYWGLFTWLPSFLGSPVAKGGAGLSVVRAPVWMIPMMVGAYIGYVTFGFISDRMGRRPAFTAIAFVLGAVSIFSVPETMGTELS